MKKCTSLLLAILLRFSTACRADPEPGDGDNSDKHIVINENMSRREDPFIWLPDEEPYKYYRNGDAQDGLVINGAYLDYEPGEYEHIIYSEGDKTIDPAWEEVLRDMLYTYEKYFIDNFGPDIKNVPIVIREAWLFDWDGRKAAMVLASNITDLTSDEDRYHYAPRKPEDILPVKTVGNDFMIYNIIAFFVEGLQPAYISSSVKYVALSPGDNHFFLLPGEGMYNDKCSEFCSSYQYDKDGQVIICPVYTDLTFGDDYVIFYDYQMQLGDIDRDGKTEAVVKNFENKWWLYGWPYYLDDDAVKREKYSLEWY